MDCECAFAESAQLRTRAAKPVASQVHDTGSAFRGAAGNMAVQRRARENTGPPAPSAGLASVVEHGLGSAGQPLNPATRRFMEPRFGRDFSHVRVHAGKVAAESAQAINANAYTVGGDVVFAAGQYSPETPAGQRLLAHELTHVVQQGGGNARDSQAAPLRIDTSGEDNAEHVADRIMTGRAAGSIAATTPAAVQAQPAPSYTPSVLKEYTPLTSAGQPVPKQQAPRDVLQFAKTREDVTDERLIAWAMENYRHGRDVKWLKQNLLNSNEFAGSREARANAVEGLDSLLQEASLAERAAHRVKPHPTEPPASHIEPDVGTSMVARARVFAAEKAKQEKAARERAERREAVFKLPAAPNAIRGINIRYLVNYDYHNLGAADPIPMEDWLLVPYVDADPPVGTCAPAQQVVQKHVYFYEAFNKKLKLVQLVIGPDSVQEFRHNTDRYNELADRAYWWSFRVGEGIVQPSAREVNDFLMAQAVAAGRGREAIARWGLAWNMAVKDPGFWVSMGMSWLQGQIALDVAPTTTGGPVPLGVGGKPVPVATGAAGATVTDIASHPRYTPHFEGGTGPVATSGTAGPYVGGGAALKIQPEIVPPPAPALPVPKPAVGQLAVGSTVSSVAVATAGHAAAAAIATATRTQTDEERSYRCGDPHLPDSAIPVFTGTDRGESVRVRPLTRCGPPGSAPRKGTLPAFNCIPSTERNNWARAHLLNENLHGLGINPNLIIADRFINNQMPPRIENPLKDRILLHDQVFDYFAVVDHEAQTGNKRFFAKRISVAAQQIDPVSGANIGPTLADDFDRERLIPLTCR